MRIPIYTRQSPNRPLLRKKLPYILELISERRAEWISNANPRLGVILKSKLPDKYEESLEKAAGSGFDSAWSIKQSGWAGPLVMQMRGERYCDV